MSRIQAKATFLVVSLLVGLVFASSPVPAGEPQSDASNQDIQLSPALMDLLRAEMREISAGMQAISLSLATADWQSIRETSGKIRDSYIMKKTLTPAQKEELKHALPERFKHLDGAFHQRADKLAEAAVNRDAEAATFHYSRMIEGCVNCHSVYAQSRFSGFSSEEPPQHDHH